MLTATRPAKALTPEQTRAAIALAQGATVTAAADSVGIHRSTLYNWFKDDPAFRCAVEEIRRERYERIKDQMRELETLALSRVRRILEDDSAPAAIQLRAAILVLNRPLDHIGLETWHTPATEDLNLTLERRPSLLKQPDTPIVRHISTLSANQPGVTIDISRQNSTHSELLSPDPAPVRPALLPRSAVTVKQHFRDSEPA